MKKMLSPDAQEGASVKTTVSNTPSSEVSLLNVAEAVNAKWLSVPGISLAWKTQAQFSEEVETFRTLYVNGQSSGSRRPSQVLTMRTYDKAIDAAVKEVKVYLEKKYKKDNAAVHFPRFGIIKGSKGYKMPDDRNARKENLALMITSIQEDGFGEEEYGTSFWTNMQENYTAALAASNNTDSAVSNVVAGKKQLRKQIIKTLTSLRMVLRGNYPDTYKQVYREWGWQKENY